jgi:hypothetical protein
MKNDVDPIDPIAVLAAEIRTTDPMTEHTIRCQSRDAYPRQRSVLRSRSSKSEGGNRTS